MSRVVKLLLLVLLVQVLALPLCGCYDYSELDERAWVLALGLDKSQEGKLAVTAVIPIPQNMGGGGEGGASGGGDEGFVTATLDVPSVISALEELDAVVDRRVDLTHAKWIVISRELAEEGIAPFLSSMARFTQIRSSAYVVVCEGQARNFLTQAKPKLEDNVGKYYELLQRGWRFTGFIPFDSFFQFYAKGRSPGVQPVALLAALGQQKSEPENAPGTNEHYLAGQLPQHGSGPVQLMGGAVFKKGRLVGLLDSSDVSVQKMVFGTLAYTILDVPDPRHPGYFIIADVKQREKPRIKVRIESGYPHITLDFRLEGDILGIQSSENYTVPDRVHIVEEAVREMLLETVRGTVAKSQDLEADFLGLGLHAKKLFSTWSQWEDYQWDEKYPGAVVEVHVDYKVRRTGLIHEMVPLR